MDNKTHDQTKFIHKKLNSFTNKNIYNYKLIKKSKTNTKNSKHDIKNLDQNERANTEGNKNEQNMMKITLSLKMDNM